MNLKPIELQIAIPRTTDAGAHQQQLLQRPVADQANLAQQSVRQAETLRRSANEVTETEHRRIKDEEPGKNNDAYPRKRQGKQQNGTEEQAPAQSEHPYKGRHIDLSL